MNAYQLHRCKEIRPVILKQPLPREKEVLLRVGQMGICGSDVHYYLHGRAGNFVMKRPFILGHKFAGEIEEIGESVRDLAPEGFGVAVEGASEALAFALTALARGGTVVQVEL